MQIPVDFVEGAPVLKIQRPWLPPLAEGALEPQRFDVVIAGAVVGAVQRVADSLVIYAPDGRFLTILGDQQVDMP